MKMLVTIEVTDDVPCLEDQLDMRGPPCSKLVRSDLS